MRLVKTVWIGFNRDKVRYLINTVMLARRAEHELVDSLMEIEAVPPQVRNGFGHHLRNCHPDAKRQTAAVI